jgi:molybdate transport system ATP-binding protein
VRLELRGLEAVAGDFRLRVDTVLDAGVTALFGRSGAGKTTLIDLIAGLRRATGGAIVIDGATLTSDGVHMVPTRSRHIGYVPQDALLFPHLSVRQNLEYGFKARGRVQSSFSQVSETLEIHSLLDRDVTTLSGGERRRVALGRALLAEPKVLLLDEPLAGLERPLQERLLTYLARIRDDFSVPMIYVTHVAEEVVQLAEHVVVLERGAMIASGPPESIFTKRTEAVYVLPRSSRDARWFSEN